LQFDDRDAFVAYMSEGQPARPANIHHIIAINQGREPLTMDEPVAPSLSPRQVDELVDDGHAVVDTRSSAAFGSGHILGAYNFELGSPEFEQRVGWVVPVELPIVLVADDAAAARRAQHKMAFVGLDHRVQGVLAGGMPAWIAAGMAHGTLAQLSVHELLGHLQNGDDIRALDVREPDEWDEGHIEGAASMSFKVLADHLDEIGIAPEDPVAVLCAGGIRSSTACSILLRNGYKRVHNVTGGMGAWNAANLPTVT